MEYKIVEQNLRYEEPERAGSGHRNIAFKIRRFDAVILGHKMPKKTALKLPRKFCQLTQIKE